jgi:RHS repeat-associated protein
MKNSTTYFAHRDHLGSTRLLTNQSVYDSLDYLPFGEQIAGATGTTHKFTGKERDTESGLDNFGARFYSSGFGTFTSVDPARMSLSAFVDPQRLNRYSYVRNNPLRNFDPDGRDTRTTAKGPDLDQMVKAVATEYRRESFRKDFNQLKKSDITFVFNKKDESRLDTSDGVNHLVILGNVELKPARDQNGAIVRSSTTADINLDLDRAKDAPRGTTIAVREETHHGVQADKNPEGFDKAQTGQDEPGREALEADAHTFRDAPSAPNDAPTMTQEEAEKVVRDMLTSPPPPPASPSPPKPNNNAI